MRKKKRLITVVMALVLTVALAVPLLSTGIAMAADTGWTDPANNAADTGGDNNGFEDDPTRAYADGAPGFADNDNGDGDRHRYWGYNFGDLSGATIDGIEVRLDANLDYYFDATGGMDVELSWNNESNWTSAKNSGAMTTSEATYILGGPADKWGHTPWTAAELGTGNFRVRITCIATGGSTTYLDWELDWVAVKVYYTLACTTYYRDHDADNYGQTGDSDCLTSPSGEYTATVGGDCNDTDDTIYPGAPEICNGIDDDCNGGTADGSDESWYEDPTNCGTGACYSTGQWECTGGVKVDSCTEGAPAADDATCDGVDDDCDGTADEDYVSDESCFLPGACAAANQGSTCVGGTETQCSTGTPAVTEDCDDGIDNDCDGVVDCDLKTQMAMILDGSGSIVPDDWDTIIDGLAAAVGNVSCVPQDGSVELTVIQFSDNARLEVGPVVITAANAAAVAADIQDLDDEQMGDYTCIACGICLAADTLAGSPNFNTTLKQALNLVTDGAPNRCIDCVDCTGECQGATCSETNAKTSAETARAYALSTLGMTADQDEFDAEFIGTPDGTSTWLKDEIVWPEQLDGNGYYAPLFDKGGGWVRVVEDADEFAETICEKIQQVVIVGACCNPATGICTDPVLEENCQDPLQWTEGVSCAQVVCEPPTGACCDPATGSCTDDVFEADCQSPLEWTEGESCAQVVCEPPECTTDGDCDDGDVCTTDTCVDGTCQNENNTEPCDDGDACTTGDTCADGACVPGTPECTTDADCDDLNADTDDTCDDGCCVYSSVVEPPPQVGVPTLTQWGMIAMGILFAAFLIWTVRRRWAVSSGGSQE